MKFAKELEKELVPEWRAKYLDYRQAKKKLKALERALSRLERTPRSPRSPRRLGTFLNPGREYFASRSPLQNQSTGPDALRRKSGDGALQLGEGGFVGAETAQQTRAAGSDSARLHEYASERQPLNVADGKAPLRSAPVRMTSYGSIIGSPPFGSADAQFVYPQAPPGRPPTLELPDAAISPEENTSTVEDIMRKRSISAADKLSMPDGGHSRGNSHTKRQTHSFRPHVPHIIRRARSAPRFQTSRPLMRRMFSLTGRHSGLPSPRGYDVPLENYKEVELRQAEFFHFLDQELNKIEAFYSAKETEASGRLQSLREQLHIMRNRRLAEVEAAEEAKRRSRRRQSEDGIMSVFSSTDADNSTNHPKVTVSWAEPIASALKVARRGHADSAPKASINPGLRGHRSVDQQPSDKRRDYSRRPEMPDVPYRTAKRKLKIALQEFYRGLELLKSYALLNRTAFRKINKKYDKTVNARPQLRYMTENVNEAWFVQSEMVDSHIRSVEDLYARYFEKGNHKVAVGKLRVKTLRQGAYSESSFRNGLTAAAGLVLGIEGVINASRLLRSPDTVIATNTSYLMQIYGGYTLMLVLLLMFCLNCKAWQATRINYVFVFEFDTRHHLDWRQLCEIPCLCVFLLGFFVWLNFGQYGADELYIYYPVILIGITLAIIFFPARVLYHRTRHWFVYSHWRLLLAGLYPVEFRDFFLGDMFCSLTYSMGGIEVFFCLYDHGWQQPAQCNSSHSRALGFLSALPGIWRALQCLRRYHDTRNVFPHLVNCGKYSFTILYYTSLSLWRIDHQNVRLKALFIFCATINSIYCSIWDLVMDWSLGDPYAPNKFLRSVLGYKKVWIYYVAMFIDPLLRFNWIFYTIFSHETQHSALLSFLVSLSEVLRRSMWTLFRIENEHCTNVGRFRASREVPLPYEVTKVVPGRHSSSLTKFNSVEPFSTSLGVHPEPHQAHGTEPPADLLTPPHENEGEPSLQAAALPGSPSSIRTAGPNVAAALTAGTVAAATTGASAASATTSGVDVNQKAGRPMTNSDAAPGATTTASGSTRRRRWSSARGPASGGPPVIIQELSRVGTLLHAAHAQDFERRKQPEMERGVHPEDQDASSDEDEEQEVAAALAEEGSSGEEGLGPSSDGGVDGARDLGRGRGEASGHARERPGGRGYDGGSPV